MPVFHHGPVELATLDEGQGEPIVLVHGFASSKNVNWNYPGWMSELTKAGLKIPAEPHGAFYIYADCGRDSKAFALELLEKEGVAATPGIDFGSNGTERCVRFAYTRSMADLEEAAARIRRFASSP